MSDQKPKEITKNINNFTSFNGILIKINLDWNFFFSYKEEERKKYIIF